MDFTLTDEQELVRDTARSLLANECPPALVRAHLDDRSAADALWERHLAGWVVLGDGPLVDQCLFSEELGAACAPGPWFATAALFVPLLRAAGLDAVADEASAGGLIGTVAMAGRAGRWEVTDEPVRAFVPDADLADRIAIVLPGPSVLVVDRDALAAAPRPVGVLDGSRRLFEIDVPADPALLATAVPVDPAALDRVVQRATVVLAADLVGVARWLVTSSVAYAKERIQFDRPIGSFQGLQFKLVDMSLDHERAAAAVYYAAMAWDAEDEDTRRAVSVAKAAAGTAARHAARDGLQTHGGIGYTWEHDLHLYLRRAYTGASLLGTADEHHDRLATLLLTPTP